MSKPLKDNVDNFLLSKNEIHPAMVMDFISKEIKQTGGDGYTIDVNRSIGGLVGRSRYSFNYSPIYYGDLLSNPDKKVPTICHSHQSGQNGGGDCGCNKNSGNVKESSVNNMLKEYLQKQQGGKRNLNHSQFDAIQQIGKGLVPLSINSLLNLIVLVFLYHSVVDKNVDNKKISSKIKKGGNAIYSILAPLGRGNLLVLASLLLLHHFAVEVPKTKKEMKGGNNIYEQMNDILKPLGMKNGLSVILNELHHSFSNKKNSMSKKQNGGSILKSIIAPLGTNAFIASGLLLIMKKMLIDNSEKKSIKTKKGGSKKDFNRLVNMLGPLSLNIFANKKFIQNIYEINKKYQRKKEIKK